MLLSWIVWICFLRYGFPVNDHHELCVVCAFSIFLLQKMIYHKIPICKSVNQSSLSEMQKKNSAGLPKISWLASPKSFFHSFLATTQLYMIRPYVFYGVPHIIHEDTHYLIWLIKYLPFDLSWRKLILPCHLIS